MTSLLGEEWIILAYVIYMRDHAAWEGGSEVRTEDIRKAFREGLLYVMKIRNMLS